MAAHTAVSHTGKAAGAKLDMLIYDMDHTDLLRLRLLHSLQKCAGDVERIALFLLRASVKNKYFHSLSLLFSLYT